MIVQRRQKTGDGKYSNPKSVCAGSARWESYAPYIVKIVGHLPVKHLTGLNEIIRLPNESNENFFNTPWIAASYYEPITLYLVRLCLDPIKLNQRRDTPLEGWVLRSIA